MKTTIMIIALGLFTFINLNAQHIFPLNIGDRMDLLGVSIIFS